MTTEYFRQGLGETKRIHALGPTTREDGTPLAESEISHYLRFMRYTAPDGTVGQTSPAQRVDLIEDAGTPEYDGVFDELLDIDSQAEGAFDIWYRTVDTDGRESRDSEVYTLVVQPPLAAPEPPTSLVGV